MDILKVGECFVGSLLDYGLECGRNSKKALLRHSKMRGMTEISILVWILAIV